VQAGVGPKALDLEDFTSHALEHFRVAGDGEVDLQLVEVSDLGPAAPVAGRRRSFSLLFRGTRDLPLGQGIHRLEHAVMGRLEMFLVPVGRDDRGMLYEAIFN